MCNALGWCVCCGALQLVGYKSWPDHMGEGYKADYSLQKFYLDLGVYVGGND